MNWIKEHKLIALFIGLWMVVIMVVVFIVSEPASEEQLESTSEAGSTGSESSYEHDIDYRNLQGFEFVSNVADGIYTYRSAKSGRTFSVSLGFGSKVVAEEGPTEARLQMYPVDRRADEIQGIEVSYGFNKQIIAGDLIVQEQRSTLAFDFRQNDINYSGEITEQNAQQSRQELLEQLENLVEAMVSS